MKEIIQRQKLGYPHFRNQKKSYVGTSSNNGWGIFSGNVTDYQRVDRRLLFKGGILGILVSLAKFMWPQAVSPAKKCWFNLLVNFWRFLILTQSKGSIRWMGFYLNISGGSPSRLFQPASLQESQPRWGDPKAAPVVHSISEWMSWSTLW